MAKGFSNFTTTGSKGGEVESENWNVAQGYVNLKILKLLITLDRYETIAQFGVDELGDEMMYPPSEIAKRRKDALFRLSATLKQLLGNVRFALKKNDVLAMNDISNRISNVENYFDNVVTIKENMVTKEMEIQINEGHFNTCFGILQNIKEEINFPINKAGLIFKSSEEVDLDAIMNEIVQGG